LATNKKAISAYLSSDIEEYLTEYCIEYDITRKDKSGKIKPALGTAVVEILRIFFSDENIPSPLPDNVPLLPSNVVTENRLAEALSEFKKTSKIVDTVPNNVLTKDDLDQRVEAAINEAIPKAIAVLKSDEEFLGAIANSVVQKISTVATEQTESSEDEDEIITQIDKASSPIFEEVEEEEKSTEPTLSVSLTDAELAKQLGMSKSTIYRYRTGKPKQSPGYQQVMNNWKPVGDRWYKQGE
jgi:predicted DNA-binding transcriptional regulator AlpA